MDTVEGKNIGYRLVYIYLSGFCSLAKLLCSRGGGKWCSLAKKNNSSVKKWRSLVKLCIPLRNFAFDHNSFVVEM